MPQISLIPLLREDTHYNLRIKEFPDATKLMCCSRYIFNPHGFECINKARKDKYKPPRVSTRDETHTRNDSLKRTKDKAFEIASANNWMYFVALTLDKSKISRTEPAEIGKKLKKWLNNKANRIGLKILSVSRIP